MMLDEQYQMYMVAFGALTFSSSTADRLFAPLYAGQGSNSSTFSWGTLPNW
jgi:hypothetical protein